MSMSNPEKYLKLREAQTYEEICLDIERVATSILDYLPEAQSSATWQSTTDEFGEITIELSPSPTSREVFHGKTVTLLDDNGIYLRQYEVRNGGEQGGVAVGLMQGRLPNAFSLSRPEFEDNRERLLVELQGILATGAYTYVPEYIRERNKKFDALVYDYHMSGVEYMTEENLPTQIARQALRVDWPTKLKHMFHARARARDSYTEMLDESSLSNMIGDMSRAERADFAQSQRYEAGQRPQGQYANREFPETHDETGW